MFARLVTILRAGCAGAIFACAALTVDYKNIADPAFCGVDSSCFKVRASDVGRALAENVHAMFGGATLPQVALFIFLSLFAFTFFLRGSLEIKLMAGLSGAGALAAVGLIVAQLQIGHLCPFCMIVDVSALVAGGAGIALALAARRPKPAKKESVREEADAKEAHDAALRERLAPLIAGDLVIPWAMAGAVLTAAPFIWERFPDNPDLPPQIQALQVPGKTTIVTFTDFQCPHCRALYPTLKAAEASPNVALHRFMVPLPGHAGATPAAQAYLCTAEDKREAMAEELYKAKPENLTPDGVVDIAAGVAPIEANEFKKCMGGLATAAKIDSDKSLFFDELAGQGLPTTWVNNVMVRGNQPERLKQALKGTTTELPVVGMYVLAAVALLGAVVHSLLRAAKPEASGPAEKSETDDAAEAEDRT
jgi:hypothetical protein